MQQSDRTWLTAAERNWETLWEYNSQTVHDSQHQKQKEKLCGNTKQHSLPLQFKQTWTVTITLNLSCKSTEVLKPASPLKLFKWFHTFWEEHKRQELLEITTDLSEL